MEAGEGREILKIAQEMGEMVMIVGTTLLISQRLEIGLVHLEDWSCYRTRRKRPEIIGQSGSRIVIMTYC
jgi:hypothetical protein